MTAPTSKYSPVVTGNPLTSFRILGHEIASDFPLRDLPRASTRQPAVTIRERSGAFPTTGALVREICAGESGLPVIQVFEGGDGIQYWAGDIGRFWIESSGAAVWYHCDPGVRAADVEHVLAGPVLGLALQLQGQVQLHASAVVIDGCAIAFVAEHGIGKSTLAAKFARVGYPLLSDDVLPIIAGPNGCRALHSLPRIKLWGDSLAALGDDERRYDIVLSRYSKRRVPVGQHWGEVAASEAPLVMMYLLAPQGVRDRQIEFSQIEPPAAALQLVGHMYLADTLRGQRAVRALDAAVQLATAVQVRRVSYYRGFDELPALQAAITADVRTQRGKVGAG